MNKHTRLCLGLFALSSLAMAAPKWHEIVLYSAAQAGDIQVAPGDYKVIVEGTNAIFTDTRTHQSFTIPVKVEEAAKKYSKTVVETIAGGPVNQLVAIEIGGSKTKLEFGQHN